MALNLKNLGEELKKKLQQTKVGQYFTPESNGGNNFWSSPVSQVGVKAQRFFESPNITNPFPTIQSNSTDKLPTQIGKAIANIPSSFGNSVIGKGFFAPLADISENIGRTLGGRDLIPYNQARSGATRLGYQIGGAYQPTNNTDRFKQTFGNLGDALMPIVDAYVPKGVKGVSSVRGFKNAVGEGIKTGTKFGAGAGLLSGLSENRNTTNNGEYLMRLLGTTVGGGVMGAGLGGLTGAGSHLITKNTTYTPEVEGILRNKLGQFKAGDKPVKPTKMSPSQWEFQLKFNKKVGRNPYTPVYPSDLQKAVDLGLSVKKLTKFEHDANVTKAGLYDTKLYNEYKNSEYFKDNKNIASTLLEMESVKDTPAYKALDTLAKERGIKDVYSELAKPSVEVPKTTTPFDTKGFGNELDPKNKARVNNLLSAKTRINGGAEIITKAQKVERLIEQGYEPSIIGGKPVLKNAKGGFFEVTKTEQDYAKHLLNKNVAQQPSLTTPNKAGLYDVSKYKNADEFIKSQNFDNKPFNVKDDFMVGKPVAYEKLPEGYKIRQSHIDSIDGEQIMAIKVSDKNGEVIGKIDYGLYHGEPNIKMIEVLPEHRRKGIATAMLDKMQEMYPDKKIDVGMSTEDGTGLLKKYDFGKERARLTDIYNKNVAQQPLSTPIIDKTQLQGKERKFSKTVMLSDKTAPEVKSVFEKQYYSPITNKQTIAEADSIIKSNLDEAINIAKNGESTALNNAVSMRLVEKFQKEGNFVQANDLLETLTKKPTSQGQAIQILSYWGKLSPTGAVKYAQTLKNRERGGGAGAFESIGEVATKRITDLANQVQSLPEGRSKVLKTAELVEAIHSVVPPTILSKISSIQAMAQLLNPKTAIRNVVGNLGFVAGENISKTASVPLDIATSLFTGKRSITAPKIGVQAKGFGLGLVEGVQEALKGVNTSQLGSQFDLPRAKTFNDPIFGTLEKALNLELRAPDRAFYRAAFDEALNSQMQINKVSEPTPEMIQQAHFDGLYRTFQDENVATKLFTGIKKALNLGKDFGLGDIVLKYPKTPANLIARGVDYSPAGFVNTVFQMAKPLFGKQFDQKAFVESFGRALTGSAGLITTGMILNKLGIITGRPEKDKDISATQRSLGIGQYRINTSALKRFIASGMDPSQSKPQEGDQLVSYDWFQPFAIGISMGANISENNGKVSNKGQVATILDSLQGGVETLAEQPLVSGLKKLFTGDPSSFVSSIVSSVKGTPASFVPTLLSQINQSQDNTSRSTYDPNMITESINMAKAKIPFASQSLPARYDVWGQPMERFQDGSNNFFNVFLNPAFVSTLKSTPEGDEVINIFERSGETQQAPRIVPKSVKINGQDVELSAEQQGVYQEYVGTRTQQLYNALVQNQSFQKMTDEDKAKKMAQLLTDINTAAKIELFGNNPKTVSKQARAILAGGTSTTKVSSINSIISGIVGGKSKKPKKVSFKIAKFKPAKLTIKKRSSPKIATIKFKKPKKTKIVRRYTIKA